MLYADDFVNKYAEMRLAVCQHYKLRDFTNTSFHQTVTADE